jgi:hypothetical protein
MKKILYNHHEHRLRAGWRIMVFVFIYTVFLSSTAILRVTLGRTTITSFAGVLVLFGATAAALWFVSRFVDHRDYREFGLGFNWAWWRDLIVGVLIGALLLTVIFIIEYTAGWVTITQLFKNQKEAWTNIPFVPTLLVAFFAYTGAALLEEILSRGYLIKNLAEGFHSNRIRSGTAVILAYTSSSLLFALFHLRNPNISIFGVVNILVLGLLLGALFLLTGELALSISLHASWNFFMGVVFGFPISGLPEDITVIATKQSGPGIWTGGAFGPEGGLIGLLAMLVGCGLAVSWIRISRGRLSLSRRLADYSHLDTQSIKSSTNQT